jgi:hypothetical protein
MRYGATVAQFPSHMHDKTLQTLSVSSLMLVNSHPESVEIKNRSSIGVDCSKLSETRKREFGRGAKENKD